MKTIRFLTVSEVLLIHQNQIEEYGGEYGLRDIGLLSFAVMMPQSSFSGKFLQEDLFEMTSAYLYHICQNHPFIDGNKRTALASSLVFLDLNGLFIEDPEDKLYELVMQTAKGNTTKKEISKKLKEIYENPLK